MSNSGDPDETAHTVAIAFYFIFIFYFFFYFLYLFFFLSVYAFGCVLKSLHNVCVSTTFLAFHIVSANQITEQTVSSKC